MKTPSDMIEGTTHQTNNDGKITILEYLNAHNVRVMFVNTLFETTAEAGNIRSGNVKDKIKPRVSGVGFIGEGVHSPTFNGALTYEYVLWKNMIDRCYSENTQIKSPTYKGCTVCNEWHNFQNFAEWFNDNYIDGLELDKDIKIKGNKVYSPDSCVFVSKLVNTIESHAKHYNFLSPKGELIKIYNMAKFCRDNNLNKGNMSSVYSGKLTQSKGWVKA